MSTESDPKPKCARCGADLADATRGLCPRCLMAEAMRPTQLDDAAAEPPLTPEELAPHFPQLEILECLGRGGMGVVYKARQKSLNRLVALKLLAPERVMDAEFAERFAQEAQALAALSHPNIVTVHEFGRADGLYFLVMEFVDGVNLRQAMKAGRFTPEQALAVVPPVCEALQYAHEHGIVHRDIKPENLLLDKDGRVKIADFGIAKMLGADSTTGFAESQPAGTPQYMAPEQREHQRTDHRADIYSLGVVLYELLTGELPAHRLQPPSRKVQIDVRLDEIVLRALSEKPELRYQTAVEFRTEVETVAQTSEPETGNRSGSEWWMWSPRQTPLIGEILAHLTEPEKAELTKRGLLFGFWNAATFFGPFFAGFFLPAPIGWILACAILVVGLSFYPMLIRMQRECLCSAAWARERGIKPDDLKSATWQPPTTGWGYFIGMIFGVKFTSRRAWQLANLSALGFLAFLGFMPLPGWQRCFGFAGLFGLIGVAHIVEFVARANARQLAQGKKPWGVMAYLMICVVIPGLAFVAARFLSLETPTREKRPAPARTAEAWQLWQSGRPAEALPLFREAVERTPQDANVWNGLGWSAFNSGQVEEAVKAFEKCVALEPNHIGALNGLGQIHLARRQYEAAEAPLLKAAKQGASASWYGLTRLYLLQGKFSDAEKWAQMMEDSGQADPIAKKMLEAAKAKQLSDGLRVTIEPPAPAN